MKLIRIIFYTLLSLITLIYFIPKVNLYYKIEHEMQPYGIVINGEHIDDKSLWLEITDARLYLHKIETLHIDNSQIMLFGLYNLIKLKDITAAPTLAQFMPKKIQSAQMHYALYNPLYIKATAAGDFGDAKITIDLYERLITISIDASKLMKSKFSQTLKNFSRDKKGVYHYEYSF